jgi:UDP-3-O-[3-hydroxymyristoyl] glucosamine N-acyltransferase
MELTLEQIAELTGGRLAGDGDRVVTRVRPVHEAGPGDLSFVANDKALEAAATSGAEALIVTEGLEIDGHQLIFHENPFVAVSKVIAVLYPEPIVEPGVHPMSSVHRSVELGEGVSVAAYATIGAGARIGNGSRIGAGAVIGEGVVLGENALIHPRVVLYPRVSIGRNCEIHAGAVVGADGFGFTQIDGRHVKVPQVGGVEIGDDVEIGANSCIDAGTLAPTRIGNNTKIDDLVMVGHNNQIGQRVLLCGQAGLAGSNTLEDDVVITGQSGVSGHLHIGKGAVAAAKTGVMRDVKPGEKVAGSPHMPLEVWRRVWKASQRLPGMRREMKAMLRRVDDLERWIDSEA